MKRLGTQSPVRMPGDPMHVCANAASPIYPTKKWNSAIAPSAKEPPPTASTTSRIISTGDCASASLIRMLRLPLPVRRTPSTIRIRTRLHMRRRIAFLQRQFNLIFNHARHPMRFGYRPRSRHLQMEIHPVIPPAVPMESMKAANARLPPSGPMWLSRI